MTFIVYGVLISAMTAEHQTEIKEKSDERWHASLATKVTGFIVAPSCLGVVFLAPDIELKKTFASLALICGGASGYFLAVDAMLDFAEKKIRETVGKQKSSS